MILAIMIFGLQALAEPVCDSQKICEMVAQAKIENDGLIPNRLSHGVTIRGGVPAVTDTYEHLCSGDNCRFKNATRMKKIFDDALRRTIKIFLNGRNERDLSPAEKNILSRFKAARFNEPNKNPACQSYCSSGGIADAIIWGKGPCLCPVVEQFPDEAVLQHYAHEIAHFGDNCQIMLDLKTDAGTVKGIRFEDHPFAQAGALNQCLQENMIPMGWWSEKDPKTQFDDYYGQNVMVSQGDGWGELILKSLKPKVRPSVDLKHHDCYGYLGGSQLTESQCDHLGWEVVGDFLKDHPFGDGDRYTALRPFAAFTFQCTDHRTGPVKYVTGFFDPHPSARDRFDKIGLNIPSLRQALGCGPNAKTCEIHRNISKPATSGWSTEISPSSSPTRQ